MSEEDTYVPTGAYAVDAVADEERGTVERHLLHCPPCAHEVRELTATAARLGTAVAATPPPGTRRQVLTWIQTVRQLPPHVTAEDVSGRLTATRARPVSRLALAACAALTTAFAGTSVWQFQEACHAEVRAEQARGETADMARVLATADARSATGSVKRGARATVVFSCSQNTAVFLASGLPELPRGRTYQLWFDDGGTMRPAGLLGCDGGVVGTPPPG